MNAKLLNEYKNIGLSDDQLLKLINGKANIVLYGEIENFKNIDDLLYPYDACIILYVFQDKPNIFGHWCLIHKRKKEIEYFDSYGKEIDYPLSEIKDVINKNNNQDYKHLSKLLIESPYRIQYNDHKFQELNPNIKTCGRYVALRLLLKDLSLKKFEKIFSNNPDDLATFLTSWIHD